MPVQSRPVQSVPLTRNRMLSLNQYLASTGFPSLGKWDRSAFKDSYVVKGTAGRTTPVNLIIICDLSSDSHFLQPHGTYNPTYMQSPDTVGRRAKLQFTVQRPSVDPELGSDYDIGHNRLLGIQGETARGGNRQNFIYGEQLRFNYNLFEKREEVDVPQPAVNPAPTQKKSSSKDSGSDTVQSDESTYGSSNEDEEMDEVEVTDIAAQPQVQPEELYAVAPNYQEIWRETEKTYANRIMPVYGLDKTLIPYALIPKFLVPGTTLIVTFTLIHYFMKEDTQLGKAAYDGFTANVVEVSILSVPDLGPSKPLSSPRKRGKYVSQAPPSRSTLKLAADTFAPVASKSSASTPGKAQTDKGKKREESREVTYPPSSSVALPSPVNVSSVSDTDDSAAPSLDVISLATKAMAKAGSSDVGMTVDEGLLRHLIPIITDYLRSALPLKPATASQSEDSGTEHELKRKKPASAGVDADPAIVAPPFVAGPTETTLSSRSEETDNLQTVIVDHDYVEVQVPSEIVAEATSSTLAPDVAAPSPDGYLASKEVQNPRNVQDKKEGRRRK